MRTDTEAALSHIGRTTPPGKRTLRQELLAARGRLTQQDVSEAADALARRALELPELVRARTVAAYVSVGTEPGTLALLDALRVRGVRVLLPALLPDNDLDWGTYHGQRSLARVQHGSGRVALLEPAGERLGRDAVTTADAVLLPGLAVDARGLRLGRGGGSYDRALARVPAGTFTCVLLHDGELVDGVPADDHDRRVRAAVTPSRLTRF
jgi:5-formyltetrahydrofolate cyclo-ligase